MLRPGPQPTRVALSQRASRRLWVVAVLDMTAVAWMIAIGNWLDQTSRLTAVITLGGHHLLVLIMALVSFLMLAAAALLTDGRFYLRQQVGDHADHGRLHDLSHRSRRCAVTHPAACGWRLAARLRGSIDVWALTSSS
jgi:hypothetical protein